MTKILPNVLKSRLARLVIGINSPVQEYTINDNDWAPFFLILLCFVTSVTLGLIQIFVFSVHDVEYNQFIYDPRLDCEDKNYSISETIWSTNSQISMLVNYDARTYKSISLCDITAENPVFNAIGQGTNDCMFNPTFTNNLFSFSLRLACDGPEDLAYLDLSNSIMTVTHGSSNTTYLFDSFLSFCDNLKSSSPVYFCTKKTKPDVTSGLTFGYTVFCFVAFLSRIINRRYYVTNENKSVAAQEKLPVTKKAKNEDASASSTTDDEQLEGKETQADLEGGVRQL